MIADDLDMRFSKSSTLAQQSKYPLFYNPDKLFSIPRKLKRDEIDIPDILPFSGFDLWNHYEVSWLNEKGKPVVALAEIIYGCDTPYLIESKSMKLYFNSFNHVHFSNAEIVKATIERDIRERVGGPVRVAMMMQPFLTKDHSLSKFDGICIDDLDITCSTYTVDTRFLTVSTDIVSEVLYSDLLKSNCLVTHQPDWGSVQIAYTGRAINHEGLLRYIVSFRNHNEFHEQCIERMFMDIMRCCQPTALTVYGRYTRRGGLDINPYRTTNRLPQTVTNRRLYRQ